VRFEAIEADGLDAFLQQLRDELLGHSYRPVRLRRVEIPQHGGKGVRVLSIPTIRDRVVQGALKLILEPSLRLISNRGHMATGRSGRRMTRCNASRKRLRTTRLGFLTSICRPTSTTVRHYILLEKVARRVNDSEVMHLLKQVVTANGKKGVSQGGVLSPCSVICI
jgi:RNA-directed DNA polymerase